jgi:hypothetical protein
MPTGIPEMIRTLEFVKEKPHMFVADNPVTSMECFLFGFRSGCYANTDINSLKHKNTIDEVTIERGWHFSPVPVSIEMRKRGLSDEEIIEELLTIEIEAWRRMESLVVKEREECSK